MRKVAYDWITNYQIHHNINQTYDDTIHEILIGKIKVSELNKFKTKK